MPLHVANGNYDFAVTGVDWYLEHLYRFPGSPITKVLDLGFGWVRIVVVVTEDMPVNSIGDIRQLLQNGKMKSLRVASEYINIADRYLNQNHMNPYKLIPTWGASEVFLPEDADVLIENTQTGKQRRNVL
jgi:ATP phosphoribosyltransferase